MESAPPPPTVSRDRSATPTTTPTTPTAGRRQRWFLRWAWAPICLLGALTGVVIAATIRMPRVDELEDFTPGQITTLFDDQGQVLQTYAWQRRVLLKAGELPELLGNAVVAVEDANFRIHSGVDLQGILGAAWDNFKASVAARRLVVVRGAGTLTMQVARELFFNRNERTLNRKVAEAFMAVEIEKRYSKDQILTLYCNLVNFAHGHYGVESASHYYFNKSVRDLTLAEAATLAGIPQRPTDYSPYRNPQLVVKRRNKVLRRMMEEGFIALEEYQAASAEPLLVAQHRPAQAKPGEYFSEEVRRHLAETYGEDALYEGGLRVETTLDRAIQITAENALRTTLLQLDHRRGFRGPLLHLNDEEDLETRTLPSWTGSIEPDRWVEGIVLSVEQPAASVAIEGQLFALDRAGIEWTGKSSPARLLKRGDVAWFRFAEPPEKGGVPLLILEQEPLLEGAVVFLESATGAVRAIVGGWDFGRSKFNRATQAQRQAGSAFKPFVMGAALENGYTAADTVFDAPVALAGADNLESYSPRNFHRTYYGITTLRRALEHSYNVSTVKLLDLVGADKVIDFARRCGIRSTLHPYPSLALGSADLTPIELAAAYGAFANQGIHVEPYLIERITSADGREVYEHASQAHKAIEPQIAYLLTQLLHGVIKRGTGMSLAGIPLDLAGKTGTTNDFGDAWFVGYSPRYTILTWVGYDMKRSIGRGMTGAAAALPIWKSIVERGLEEGWLAAGETFPVPPGISTVLLEYYTGLLAGPGAETVIRESFVAGTEPTIVFDPSLRLVSHLPWYQQRPFYLPKEGERMPEQVQDWELVRAAWADRSEARARVGGSP